MPKKLIQSFSFTFPYPVWKTVVDSATARLFLELRDAEEQTVNFAAVDLHSGQVLWQDVSLPEISWGGTLHSASSGFLLLQSFTDTHNPEEKAYYALDLNHRKLVWQSDTFRVVNLTDDYIIGHQANSQDQRLEKIALPSGKMVEMQGNEKIGQPENKALHQPFFYSEDQPYFTTVASFVKSLGLGQPVGGCEYLEYADYVFVAYYVPRKTEKQSILANYLLILDRQGNILLHECLETAVPQVGLGTFFIAQNQLIVVQHQRQLVSYALS